MNVCYDGDSSTMNGFHLPAQRHNHYSENVQEARPVSYSERLFGVVRSSGFLRVLTIELEHLSESDPEAFN